MILLLFLHFQISRWNECCFWQPWSLIACCQFCCWLSASVFCIFLSFQSAVCLFFNLFHDPFIYVNKCTWKLDFEIKIRYIVYLAIGFIFWKNTVIWIKIWIQHYLENIKHSKKEQQQLRSKCFFKSVTIKLQNFKVNIFNLFLIVQYSSFNKEQFCFSYVSRKIYSQCLI